MKTWLAPTTYMQELEHAQELREDDTAEWILDEPSFIRWKAFDSESKLQSNGKKPNKNTLWIQGKRSPSTERKKLISPRQSWMWKNDPDRLHRGGS